MYFSDAAKKELTTRANAVVEITGLALKAFEENDLEAALDIEPLEEIIDNLKERLRANHIERLQKGGCSIEAGFVWSDLITNLERVSDHCSNIGGCVIETSHNNLNMHEGLRRMKSESPEYKNKFEYYFDKYKI